MNKDYKTEFSHLKQILNSLLSLYKLTHIEEIKIAKKKALSSPARRKVYHSCDGKRGVTEIAKALKLKQPTVSHHLIELSELGLVSSKTKKGKKYFFKVI